ncbi:MAG TPA: class I SAM-dependent methyltransferase [Abditibacterium sp.]
MKQPSLPRHHRLAPPFWRHDWYSLSQLKRAVETAISGHLSGLSNGTIVDVGAGEAPYAPLFKAAGHRYIRCDLDGEVEAKITPGAPIPLQNHLADAVVSFQVLEHVWDLDWYLNECHRLLKPHGKLLLSTHGVWLYHPHPTDFRRWTRDGLKKELEIHGFEVIEILTCLGPLAWTTQFRALGYYEVLRRFGAFGKALTACICTLMNARMIVEDFLTPRSIRETNASVYLMVARPLSR